MNNDTEISILIADDEKSIRDGLKNSILWNELNIFAVNLALDGEQALALILKDKPDICIIDICMPKLTGLDVIKECRRKKINTEFIILSGYSDFKFAQEALSFGVKSYLLKPIDFEKLQNELYIICNNIIDKRSLDINIDYMKKKSNFYILNQLIKGEIKNVDLDFLMLENLKIDNSPCRVIVFTLNFNENAIHFEDDIITLLENISFPMPYELWSPNINEVTLLFNDNSTNLNFSTLIAKQCMEKLKPLHSALFGIGIGDLVQSLDKSAYSYNSALIALSYQMYNEEPTIHDTSKICNTAPAISPANINYNNLTNAIFSSDLEKINEYCDNFFSSLFYVPKPPPTFVKGMCIYLAVNVLKELNTKIQHNFSFPLISYEELNHLTTFNQLKNWLLVYFYDCSKILFSINSDNNTYSFDKVIINIKNYIDSNINGNLKTKNIAKFVNLSESYCSAYFKQKTGISIRDYILNSKIEYAKVRILENKVRVNEISFELGYADYRSFSRAFKNATGLSPSEYSTLHLK